MQKDPKAKKIICRCVLSSIRVKLIIAFLCLSLITLMVGSASVWTFEALNNAISTIGRDNLPSVITIERINSALNTVVINERTLLIPSVIDPVQRSQNYTNIKNAFEQADQAILNFDKYNHTPDEMVAWNDFQAAYKNWKEKHSLLMKEMEKRELDFADRKNKDVITNPVANQEIYSIAMQDVRPARNKANTYLLNMISLVQKNTKFIAENALASSESYRSWRYFPAGIGFVVAILLGVWYSRRITRPLLRMVGYIAEMAKGDISKNVDEIDLRDKGELGLLSRSVQELLRAQRDEVAIVEAIATGDYTSNVLIRSNNDKLGLSMQTMLDNSNDALGGVDSIVRQVAASSASINNASQSLSQGAMETAASVEEISASITQISRQTSANAHNATEADTIAGGSRGAAERGYQAMAELMSAMTDMRDSGKKISIVVKTIEDIAFQTNLLALNASVEAARAGRHGKGFSVVANEVRNLSVRSSKAAKETAQLIDETVKKLENGSMLAEHTDATLREIVQNVGKVADLFREIARASNEQSQGISQIANGLKQIDVVTQRNMLNTSETASNAVTLNQQAESLRRIMSHFKLRETANGNSDLLMRWSTDVKDSLPPPDHTFKALLDKPISIKLD